MCEGRSRQPYRDTSHVAAVRLRARIAVWLTCTAALGACDSVTVPNATSRTNPTAIVSPPRPCTFVTRQSAAAISGDAAVTNQALNVFEAIYGYVACIYRDPMHEADSASDWSSRCAHSRSCLSAAARLTS